MTDKDPYSFLPNMPGLENEDVGMPQQMDQETAERFKRFAASKAAAQPAPRIPETPAEMEEFAQAFNQIPRNISFGPDGGVDTGLKLKAPPKQEAPPTPDYSELKGKIEMKSSLDFMKKPSQVNANPLTQYYRAPELYVRLPSQGIFNEDSDFEFTVDGQVGIFPMTSQDDVALRTPDALLNGAALEKIIKSCVPGIKNVRALPNPDFDVIMLAIRAVSNGTQLDYDTKCPKCSTMTAVGIDIPAVLETVEPIKGPAILVMKNGVKITIHPYTFDSNVKASLVAFEEAQLIRAIQRQDSTEQEKMLQFNESFDRISRLNRDLFTAAIAKVETPTGAVVVEKQFIREFLDNMSSADFDAIEGKLKALNSSGFQRQATVTCSNPECKHEHQIDINYDPTRFFGKGF